MTLSNAHPSRSRDRRGAGHSPRIPTAVRRWAAVVLLGVLALGVGGAGLNVSAQGSVEGWSDPLNLSRSGGAENPRLLVTSSGAALVVWDDSFSASAVRGGMGGYAVRLEEDWGPPIRVDFPFAGRPLQLLAGAGTTVHAFWIDSTGSLRHGAAPITSFGSAGTWGGGQVIASSVSAFDVVMDSDGRIHVVCLVAAEGPTVAAGIYYLRSGARVENWSAPVPLYQSDYYRAFLSGGQGRPAASPEGQLPPHVEVEVAEGESSVEVFAAWDNPSLKRVFLATSTDGGGTWGPPLEIDGPNPDNPYSTPRELMVSAAADQILLLWQVSESGGSCTQVYRTSEDAGATWSDAAPVLSDQTGCLEGIKVLGTVEGNTLAYANLQGQAMLLAWNGEEWSLPQSESGLDYFTDPETFSFVQLDCRQAALSGDRLLVAGCGLGTGGTDIWLTDRLLDDVSDWFDPSRGWAELGQAALTSTDVLSLTAAGDGEGAVIALWSQPDADLAESVTSQVSFAGWNRQDLIGPFPVLNRLPGLARQLRVIGDSEGRLLLVWTGGETGELSFSWASMPEAGSPSGWYPPEEVPSPGVLGESPRLMETAPGSVVLAYAIGFNESRGIYLAESSEPGFTWGEPAVVFDAPDAGCDKVEQASLTMGPDGALHLAWICASAPGGIGPLAVFHARSADGGATWSDPSRVLERRAAWGQLAVDGNGDLHFVWEERLSARINTWDSRSRTGGDDWEEPLSVSVVDGAAGLSELVADSSGRLHLLQAVQEEGTLPSLRYTEWTGSAWASRDALALSLESIDDLGGLACAVDSANGLVAVYAGLAPRDQAGVREARIHFSAIPLRAAPAPQGEVAAEGGPTSTPVRAEATDAPAPTPTPVAVARLSAGEASEPGGGGPIGILAGVATGAVMLAGIAFALLRPRRAASTQREGPP